MAAEQHREVQDRRIADTGWGVKPDDQPANASDAQNPVPRTWNYDRSQPDVIRRILLAQRRGFNTAGRVRVEPGRTLIIDINKDVFAIEGLGFGDENLVVLLRSLGAAFNPQELRALGPDEPTPREYLLSRAWAWGAERPV